MKRTLSQFSNFLIDTYHLSSLWLRRLRGKVISIELISVEPKKRGYGYGEAAMRELLAYADEFSFTLVLVPSEEYGSNLARLTRWYESLGFTQIQKGFLQMIRLPKPL